MVQIHKTSREWAQTRIDKVCPKTLEYLLAPILIWIGLLNVIPHRIKSARGNSYAVHY